MTEWKTLRLYKDWYVTTGIYFPKEYCEFVKKNWNKSKDDKPKEEEYRKKLKEIIESYDKVGITVQQFVRNSL
jgi:hypothetical protein